MLLKALYDFAHSRNLLKNLAFAPKAIRWVIRLDDEGNLLGVTDTSEDGKIGREYPEVPKVSGSKNAGGIAEFLADNLIGLFGLEPEPENLDNDEGRRQKRFKNNEAKYESFWHLIQEAFAKTTASSVSALIKFHSQAQKTPPFLRWGDKEGAKASGKQAWWIMSSSGEETKYSKAESFTFLVSGNLVLDDELLRDWWRKTHQQEVGDRETESQRGLCMVTGQDDVPIATTHTPMIKGVKGAQQTGAALVSFDKPAFTSYGFNKSLNAPASNEVATAYCVALNHLLDSKNHSLRVGGMTVCFWARNSEEATDVFTWAFDQPKPESVRDFLNAPRTGIERSLSEPDEFYSVTLSGNGGRVVVRHWMQMPVENAVTNLRRWFTDLTLVTFGNSSNAATAKRKIKKTDNADDDNEATAQSGSDKESTPPLGLYRLAAATVRDAKKNLQADVPSQLYRAALEGTAPPLNLLKPILNRLKADLCKFGAGILETPISGKVIKAMTDSKTPIPPPGQSRMALIKMLLNRNRQIRKEGEPPMIEPEVFETDDHAYNCGRLLAVLAEAQQKAHDYDLNTGVAERYFGTACASPSSVFPLLIKLNRHHLNKISKSVKYKGHERFLKEAIQKILVLFKPSEGNKTPAFPRSLDLHAQGRFALGFYQQQASDAAARSAAIDKKNQSSSNQSKEQQ